MRPSLIPVLLLLGATSACAVSASFSVQPRPAGMTAGVHTGPIQVFAAGPQPHGSEIGPVEVHGLDSQARVDLLMGRFLDRVAQLGGNAAVIDDVVPRFEVLEHPRLETFTFPCEMGTCSRERLYGAGEELLVVSMRGRAFLLAPPPKGSP